MTRRHLLVLLLALLLAASPAAWSAPPSTLNYQGRLTQNGTPVTGTVKLTFRLYEQGTKIWTETHPAVSVTDGLYSVTLGSIVSLGALSFDEAYELGISVGGESEMTPLQPLTAVPYARRAASADAATTANALSAGALDRYGLHSARPSRTNTLTTVDSAGAVGFSTSMTLGADGLPVIAYQDYTNADLKVARCVDAACTSATLTTLDSAGDVGDHSSITVGADGLPVIAYQDYTNTDLKVARCADAACTGATLTTIDSIGDVGFDTSITLGADGRPVIAYYDDTNDDLKVAKCTDDACTGATLTTVDNSGGNVGQFTSTSITLGTDGWPVIAYHDSSSRDLKVAKCADAACTSATLTTVDSAGDVGGFTSVTLGTNGWPVIAYYDDTNGDLKVAKCTDAACTGALLSTVDSAGVVGWYTSITLGPDGWPMIAYHDFTNEALKVAKCADVACADATLTTVDSDNNAVLGWYSSITLGTDGRPVISYYHASDFDLKVVKCANAWCVNYLGGR